jgi:hypothetical protein
MRTSALICIMLLVSFPSLALAGPHDADISLFMKNCLQENESFSKERIASSNTYIISVGKFEAGAGTTYTVHDSFMVTVDPNNSSKIILLNNTAEVEGAFRDLYASMNLTYDSLYPNSFETGEILAQLLRYNDSREPEESKCRLWIGTDTPEFQCYDRESCFTACHTPMSRDVASGVGWPFVDSVWLFTNDTKAISSNLSAVLKDLESIESKSGNPQELLGGIEQKLARIQNSSDSISQNGLFDVYRYSFCWPVKFNRTSLITAKVLVKRIKERMQPLFDLPEDAQAMALSASMRAKICKANLAKLEKPKTRVTFWGKLSKEQRNFLRSLVAVSAPDSLLPIPARQLAFDWE